jgi:C-terminal processing protease CtpA/Prc
MGAAVEATDEDVLGPELLHACVCCPAAAGAAVQVLAGALKDSGRGRIAGERTFGKGLIQTVIDLSDGSGVAVTVARYQTPAGVDINKIGISPDVAVDPEALPTDPQRVCAALSAPDSSLPKLFS